MHDISQQIEKFLNQGISVRQIADHLEVSLEWVLSVEWELIELVEAGAYDNE